MIKYFTVLENIAEICDNTKKTFSSDGLEETLADFQRLLGDSKPIVISDEIVEDAKKQVAASPEVCDSNGLIEPLHPFGCYWLEAESLLNRLGCFKTYTEPWFMYGALIYPASEGYICWGLMQKPNGQLVADQYYINQEIANGTVGAAMNSIFCSLTHEIQKRETYIGKEKTSFRARVGSGEARQLVKVNQVLRIVRKKEIKKYDSNSSNKIEWQHCWSVMGHWRLQPGRIGKDNKGHYTQMGRTWVNPCVKGNLEAPYIKKIRHLAGGEICG